MTTIDADETKGRRLISGVILRVLGVYTEVRSMEESPRHPSFTAADRDRDAERMDSVAGSEFVDDRIRLRD